MQKPSKYMKAAVFSAAFMLAATTFGDQQSTLPWFDADISNIASWPATGWAASSGATTAVGDMAVLSNSALDIDTGDGELEYGVPDLALNANSPLVINSTQTFTPAATTGDLPDDLTGVKGGLAVVGTSGSYSYYGIIDTGSGNDWVQLAGVTPETDPAATAVAVKITYSYDSGAKIKYEIGSTALTYDSVAVNDIALASNIAKVAYAGCGTVSLLNGTKTSTVHEYTLTLPSADANASWIVTTNGVEITGAASVYTVCEGDTVTVTQKAGAGYVFASTGTDEMIFFQGALNANTDKSAETAEATVSGKVQIGTTYYLSLKAAMDAVENNETVTILADLNETEQVTLTGKTGVTITNASSTVSFPKAGFNYTFVINNSSITFTGAGTYQKQLGSASMIQVKGSSVVTINAGTFIGGKSDLSMANDAPSNLVQCKGGQVIVNDGTFINYRTDQGRCVRSESDASTVTINGGTFEVRNDSVGSNTGSGRLCPVEVKPIDNELLTLGTLSIPASSTAKFKAHIDNVKWMAQYCPTGYYLGPVQNEAGWYQVAQCISVAAPTAAQNLTYTGSAQTGVAAETGYTVADGAATDAGNYTATATLDYGYIWNDSTTAAKSIQWSIAVAAVTPAISFDPDVTEATWTDSLALPTASVATYTADDYTAGWDKAIPGENPADDFVITYTVTMKGNYSGSNTKTFTVKPATAPASLPDYMEGQSQAMVEKYNTWANTYGPDTDSAYEEAFLLNCEPGQEAAAKALFKIPSISIDGSGNVTVGTPIGTYNGVVTIKGSATVDGEYNLAVDNANARFFKAFLEMPTPAN